MVPARPSVIQLRQFYSSRLGRLVKKRLRQRVLEQWGEHGNETVLGVGYAPPFLRALERHGGGPVVALMPADQGAIYWPVHTDNRSILADEALPPFSENSLQRVLMVHALECAAQPDEVLRAYWQLLAPGGRLLAFVPNRFGIWAHAGRSPFARGRSWRIGALKDAFEEAQFTLRDCSTALYAPPSTSWGWQRLAGLLEWAGRLLLPGFGGVIVIEAEKQIYAGIGIPVEPARARRWHPASAPVPVTERRGD